MRAALLDAQGPLKWRFLRYLPGLALFVASIGLAFAGVGPAGFLFGLSLVVTSGAGLLPLRQRNKRDVTIVCGPGYVDVPDAGMRTQRIHAKEVYGATTARTRNGVTLTLAHRDRDEPIVLEVADEGEADAIRRALGIGHGGFGTVAWRTMQSAHSRGAVVGRLLTFFTTSLILAWSLAGAVDGLAGILGFFAGAGMLAQIVEWLGSLADPSIIMAPEGLRLLTTRGWFLLPYDQVQGIEIENGHVFFKLPAPWFQVAVRLDDARFGSALSADERTALLAQIRSATERAHGLGKAKDDRSGRLDTLRRNGASLREWLVRLDMAGQMLAQSSAGYRGNSLEPDDLWAILEDPEAETELRTAAARVLRHSNQPETRVRIDAAVAAVRETTAHERIRVATTDDLDAASMELARLEAAEMQEPLRVAHLRPVPR